MSYGEFPLRMQTVRGDCTTDDEKKEALVLSVEKSRSLPIWLLCGLIAVAVIAIGVTVWRGFAGDTAGIPDKAVHPGMYDFRKEAENGTLGRRSDVH
jgi:hypothetical protein